MTARSPLLSAILPRAHASPAFATYSFPTAVSIRICSAALTHAALSPDHQSNHRNDRPELPGAGISVPLLRGVAGLHPTTSPPQVRGELSWSWCAPKKKSAVSHIAFVVEFTRVYSPNCTHRQRVESASDVLPCRCRCVVSQCNAPRADNYVAPGQRGRAPLRVCPLRCRPVVRRSAAA